MNKKLVVGIALVFVVALGMFAVFSNSSRSFNVTEMFNLHGRVIDYGTYSDPEEVLSKMTSEEIGDGEKIYIVLGDGEDVTLSTYEEIVYGNIGIIAGTLNSNLEVGKRKESVENLAVKNNKFSVELDGEAYNFEVTPEESVYLVVKSE